MSRPQASLADFYRELGHLFGVALAPHNRWRSCEVLREKWLTHIENSLYRPVLLVDEAQEMKDEVFGELRLLSSADLDSRSILTIILCGDHRLSHRLEGSGLLPIASRIRSRLRLDALSPKELAECLNHLCAAAGNPKLMTPPLVRTLCEHAAGNLRLLMNMANSLGKTPPSPCLWFIPNRSSKVPLLRLRKNLPPSASATLWRNRISPSPSRTCANSAPCAPPRSAPP